MSRFFFKNVQELRSQVPDFLLACAKVLSRQVIVDRWVQTHVLRIFQLNPTSNSISDSVAPSKPLKEPYFTPFCYQLIVDRYNQRSHAKVFIQISKIKLNMRFLTNFKAQCKKMLIAQNCSPFVQKIIFFDLVFANILILIV